MSLDRDSVEALGHAVRKVVCRRHFGCADCRILLLVSAIEVPQVDMLGSLVETIVSRQRDGASTVTEEESRVLVRRVQISHDLARRDYLLCSSRERYDLRLRCRQGYTIVAQSIRTIPPRPSM